MNDPLALHTKPLPLTRRLERVAPIPHAVGLHTRITSGEFADSLETRVTLLAHLLFQIYLDLKEHQQQCKNH